MSRKKLGIKAQVIFRQLKKAYPDATIALIFSNPLELLIATILSAQCTDVRVNEVTKVLFRSFRKPEDYIRRPQSELEGVIRSTGFFRQKARSIRGAVARILEQYEGRVPQTMEALTTLPGVGRKTANVVLGNAFNLPGLPVDTHVTRIANRLGLTKNTDTAKIEFDLNALLPPKNWCEFSHLLIIHGRRVCKARRPSCPICPVLELCPYPNKTSPLETKKSGASKTNTAKSSPYRR